MKYIVNQNGQNEIIDTIGFIPDGVICEAPEGEDIEWLDIIIDANAPFGKRALVNSTTKTQTLSDRAAAEAAIIADKTIRDAVSSAMSLGKQVMEDIMVENVSMGITADSMTETVLDTMAPVEAALRTGSLHVAIDRLKAIPAEDKDPKYITNVRILEVVNRLEEHLGLPLTQSL